MLYSQQEFQNLLEIIFNKGCFYIPYFSFSIPFCLKYYLFKKNILNMKNKTILNYQQYVKIL